MSKKIYKKRSFWVITFATTLVILGILSFRPIINPQEEDCFEVAGILEKYRYLPEVNDVQLKVKQSDKIFYINNIYDGEIYFSDLDSLVGKEIIIYAVKHWSLLDPKGKYKHIARITNTDKSKIIYSEF